MKEENRKVYVAEDGKEFLDKKECESYEKKVGNIKYFRVAHSPDLTETGSFVNRTYVAVYSNCYHHKDVVINYFLQKFGYLCTSVMGYGFQTAFDVYPCTKEDFIKAESNKWGGRPTQTTKMLLSPIDIEGFEERFDYYKEWGFK